MARPARPEPKFFLVDEIYEKGIAHYARWFEGARPDQIAGEKSTNYLESAAAASRMRADLPAVRLVFILRDPVERAYSNYLWSRMNGLEKESFESALALEGRREQALDASLKYARPFSYFSRGLYADLLAPFFESFPRERILVLRFEDIEARPQPLAETLARFLGVEPRPRDAADMGVVNASEKVDSAMPDEARRLLTRAYAEPNRRLARLLGNAFPIWEPTNV